MGLQIADTLHYKMQRRTIEFRPASFVVSDIEIDPRARFLF
jgi:hypothetical protein